MARVLSVVLLTGAACGADEKGPRSLADLTGNWWLALDERVWESRGSSRLVFHAFEKYSGNPVVSGDKAWDDGMPYAYGTVLPAEDGKVLRMGPFMISHH